MVNASLGKTRSLVIKQIICTDILIVLKKIIHFCMVYNPICFLGFLEFPTRQLSKLHIISLIYYICVISVAISITSMSIFVIQLNILFI